MQRGVQSALIPPPYRVLLHVSAFGGRTGEGCHHKVASAQVNVHVHVNVPRAWDVAVHHLWHAIAGGQGTHIGCQGIQLDRVDHLIMGRGVACSRCLILREVGGCTAARRWTRGRCCTQARWLGSRWRCCHRSVTCRPAFLGGHPATCPRVGGASIHNIMPFCMIITSIAHFATSMLQVI